MIIKKPTKRGRTPSRTKPIKKKNGRPTKFTKEIKVKVEKLSRKGFTDKEVSEFVGINEVTIHRWKIKHPKFCKSLKMWKESSNENVKVALYERACGYSHADTKAQWVESLTEKGRWEYADLIKHYPPDTAAAFIWLKNRDPKNWRDTRHIEATGKDGGPIETKAEMSLDEATRLYLDNLK